MWSVLVLFVCFGRQSEDMVTESSMPNVAFPSVSSQLYRHHAPHPAPVRHHTMMSAQPVLLQPLPSTEFIVSSLYIYIFIHRIVDLSIGTKNCDLEWPWTAKWPLLCVILLNLVVSGPHCIKVVDKAITMDNLRLLCLVVNVCRGTAWRPRYKYSITARWKFRSIFINSRLNAQYLPSCRLICYTK